MRVILVPVADRPECARALNTAFELGKKLDASVSGCHIRPHKRSDLTLSSEFAAAAWRRKSTPKAPADAQTLYKRIAEQHGYELIHRARAAPGALWAERVGSPHKLMSIVGPLSDLIVVSRPRRRDGVAGMFLNAALMHGSSPVLLLPQAGRRKIGDSICIAWDQGPRVARTVTASIPLLQLARQVTIVSCGPEDRPGPKATQLVAYLKHWGVQAKRIRTHGRHIETELMDACQEVSADLIVSGAYSRQRWYEKVLGGTTEFLIHETRLPVLMQHV
jgi:nucleotide-binding universal stress UspA family protein